tara:strand:- start:187 stop:705 length:519 start_codon:yes stop_codon:yes gene_type:complete
MIKHKELKFEKYLKNKDIVREIGRITNDIDNYYSNEEILFIGVLNGCIPFMNQILSNSTNSYSYQFIQISSYLGTESGDLKLHLGLDEKYILNKNVVIVEDIIDSGKSIKYLKKYISKMNPKSIKIASLLVKKANIELCDWYGFKISDKFVIGFGLDLDGSFRYLKDIYKKV